MAKYLFVYHGGEDPTTEEEIKEVMDAWGAWLGGLGAAVIDGGNPVGPTKTVAPDGSVSDTGEGAATGYGLFEASSMEDAIEKAKGCPIREANGSIEVCEAFDM